MGERAGWPGGAAHCPPQSSIGGCWLSTPEWGPGQILVESLTFAPDNLTAVGIVLYFVCKCLLDHSAGPQRHSKGDRAKNRAHRCAGVAQLAEQLFCKQQVIGSSPIVGSGERAKKPRAAVRSCRRCSQEDAVTGRAADMGGCPSGQWELTVNQPADAYGGSNPPPPTVLPT
jgi:hypothetical protein